MALTTFARTVDALLRSDHDTTLEAFINIRRDKGQTWGQIATALSELTNGTVHVTRTTVTNWADDLEVAS